MRFPQFRQLLHEYDYFSVAWVYRYVPSFDKRRLYERTQKGYLTPLKRGRYLFADVECTYELTLHLANVLYRPSYVSLFTALAYHGLVPETVIAIQSITPKKTTHYDLNRATREYRSCKESSFGGYVMIPSSDTQILMATPEKAIVDLIYYHPQYRTRDDFASLRINTDRWHELVTDYHRMRQYGHIS